MRSVVFAFLLLPFVLTAQPVLPTVPPSPELLDLAGQELLRAGNKRNAALFSLIAAPIIGGILYAADPDDTASIIAGSTACVALSMTFAFAGNRCERRAGMYLQGKRPKPRRGPVYLD